MRHVILKRCSYTHYGCAGRCTDDLATVIGFVVEADYTASLVFHVPFLFIYRWKFSSNIINS